MSRKIIYLLLLLTVVGSTQLFPQQTLVNIDAENYTNTFRSMHVDVEQRGCDYAEAYNRLHEHYPDYNIFAVVKGVSIDHITGMEVLPQKSLMMIHYGKYGSPKTKIAHVDDIEEMGVRSISRSPVSVYFPQSTDHEAHDHHHIHDVDDTPNHYRNPNIHIHQVPPIHHHHHHSGDGSCEDCEEDY